MEFSQLDLLKQTPLHSRHEMLGAKMAEFSGWHMPIHYGSQVEEHLAVRQGAGLFDVSHMGLVEVTGPDAEAFVDYLSTNLVLGRPDGAAIYTVWADEQGGCVDDVILLRESSHRVWVVVNAGNRDKDLQHLRTYQGSYQVQIHKHFDRTGLIALQGPRSRAFLERVCPQVPRVAPMRFGRFPYEGTELLLAGTGYTGSGGFELMGEASAVVSLWDRLVAEGVKPVGLGARDTLRLEMGYALYGHELTPESSPLETVSAWTVKMKKRDFLGRGALQERSVASKQVGLVLQDPGVPRQGYPVYYGERQVGQVTSGTFSPSLQKGIAIASLPLDRCEGEEVEVEIRRRRVKATVVSLPLVKVRGG